MSNTIGGATIELGVNSSGVDSGMDHIDARVDRTGRNLQNLGSQGSRALESIGDGGSRAAAGIDTATRNIAQQLQRAVAAFGAGKKSGSEFFEELARSRNGNMATLTPLLTQLKELEAAQARAGVAAATTAAAQQAAALVVAEAARTQAAAVREAAQAQARGDTFLATLREQAALYGKSADEVMRYRAAQAGAAGAAEPLIQELARLRTAEDAVATAARAAALAQQQAAQVQAKSDSFVVGLREQVALYGKAADEVTRYRAAQAGAAGAAEPLIQELARLKAAEDAVATAAQAAAQAQQAAAQAQAKSDTFVAGLREQAALYGKSADEVLRYRAAQAGAVGAAEPLIQELARLKAAEDAVAAAARAAATAQQQATQAQVKSDTFVAGLREQVALYGKSADEMLRYRAAQAGAAGAAEPLIQELARLKAAEDAVATAARAAALAQQQAAQVQTGRDNFISSLQQQATAIGKTRTELLELQAAQHGVTAQAAPFIAALRAQEQGLNNTGMSARATAAALRNVPAQFTDIITSLQGGQAPLTVLLQQGGQLKDMFGGAGNAAKALGGYVLGLVNPVTIAAVAAAALTVAFVQGRNESIAYRQALITTGNAAGTTAGQLSDMARGISASIGTQGAAAEAVAALAGTGKVAASNLQEFGLVAIQVQRALGKSVQDTAGDFADLGKAPSATLLKLNEQYRFLTGEVYSQVKALEMQGRTIEAATVAQLAYASGASSVSTKVAENLGTLHKAWVGITDVAKSAWDAMLDVGREDSLEEKLSKVQASITKARKPFDPSVGGNSEPRSQLAGNLVLERLLQGQIKLKNDEAKAERELNIVKAAGLAWDVEKEKYLTRAQQRDSELDRAQVQGDAAGVKQEEIEKRLVEIRKKYADVYSLTIDQQIEKNKARGDIEEEQAKRTAMDVASSHAAGLATSLVAEIDYRVKLEELDQAMLQRKKERLQEELRLTAGKANTPDKLKQQAALSSQIALIDEQSLTRSKQTKNEIYELDIKNTRQISANIADVAEKRIAEADALNEQVIAQRDANALIGKSKSEVADYNRNLVEQAAARRDVAASLKEQTPGLEIEAKALRDSAVAMRALGDAQRESILKTAQFDQQKKIWESIDQTAHDTFVSIFDSGKSAFDRLRDTLKSGLLDLLYQMTIKKWIFNVGAQISGNSAIGDLGGALGSGGGGGGAGSLLSNGASLLSIGKTIYSGFAGGIASSLGGLVSSFGSAIGSSAVTSFGAGMSLTTAQAASAAAAASGTTAGAAAGGALTAGAGAAAAIPIVGWIIAGMMASKGLYAQGWDANNGSVSQLGLAAGGRVALQSDSILQKLGMSAVGANILSGQATIAKLFGRKNPEVESSGIQGTFSAGGFTGENYANILEKGGWFRSDKRYSKTAGLTADQDTGLDDTIKAMISSVKGFGSVLGAESSIIDNYSKTIKLELGNDEAKNKETIAKLFSDIGDELSTKLVPNIAKFSAEGETASATLQRLAGDYKSVDSVLVTIGRTSIEAFGSVGIASIEARERLIAAAGGLDQLANGTAFFAQNFLSPEEQMKPIIQSIGEQLTALGLAGTDTTAEFKAAVLDLASSGKLATEAGATQYAALLALAPQFKQMTDYTESLGNAAKQAATDLAQLNAGYESDIKSLQRSLMTSAQARADDVAGMDKSTLAFYEHREALQAEVAAMDKAKQAATDLAQLNAGYESDIKSLQRSLMTSAQARADDVAGMDKSTLALYEHREALQAQVDAIEKMKGVAQMLRSVVDTAFASLTASVNDQKDQLAKSSKTQLDLLQQQIDAASSSISNLSSMSASLRSALEGIALPEQGAATRAQAQAQIASALAIAKSGGPIAKADDLKSALSTIGKDSSAQFSSYLDYQRDLYRTANDLAGLADLTEAQLTNEEKALALAQKQKDIAQQAYEAEVSRLDSLVAAARDQISQLDGINTSILTIPAALAAIATAIAAVLKNPISAAPAVTAGSYQQYLGRDATATEIEYWKDQASKGVDVVAAVKGSAEAKIQDLYKTLLGRTGETAGVDLWVRSLASGQTLEQVKASFLASAEYKKLHPFAIGTNYVPRDMPAYIHEGEAIIPAADNRELMTRLAAPKENNAALLAEVIRLRASVERLQGPADRSASGTESMSKTLTRVTQGKDWIVTKEYV